MYQLRFGHMGGSRCHQPLIAGQMGPDPCYQFVGRKGLYDIIIGTNGQPADFINVLLACRHQQDGDFLLLPHRLADGQPIQIRQHDIQKEQIIVFSQRLFQPLTAVHFHIHGKAVKFQIIPLQFSDIPVIFHQQYFFHQQSSCPFCPCTVGSAIQIVSPFPCAPASAQILPPCASTIRLPIASPRPLPRLVSERASSVRKNS